MSPPFSLGAGADPEVSLAGSPLAARVGLMFAAPPIVAWTGSDDLFGETHGKPESAEETDMKRLGEEYRMQQKKGR